MKMTVFGAGAWGTAMAIALSQQHEVMLWARNAQSITEIKQTRENKLALPGFILPEQLLLTSDFEEALSHSLDPDSLALLATTVSGLRPTVQRMAKAPPANVVWLCKGFEEETALLPHQIVSEILGESTQKGVLSGPSFAREVAAGLPCALTIASDSPQLRQLVKDNVNHGNIRVYSSDDVIGVEVGGAVKNILAIASGLSDGMELGTNARAALISRGLAEITRLGIALGGRLETFMGLTGVGDLILTCTGDLSRNRRVGFALAQGKALDDIVKELGHVAEGVRCARAVQNLAKNRGVEMPIVNAVVGVLFEDVSPGATVAQLLSRNTRYETDQIYSRPG
jgi:glycerol-3-phosphate dehydrogenase (NAD(P)+)